MHACPSIALTLLVAAMTAGCSQSPNRPPAAAPRAGVEANMPVGEDDWTRSDDGVLAFRLSVPKKRIWTGHIRSQPVYVEKR